MKRPLSQRLVEAPTVDGFLAAPRNAYVVGPHCLYFQAGAKLTGYLLWGTPSAADFDMLEFLVRKSCLRLGAHPTLVDGRAIEGAQLLPFERLRAFVTRNRRMLRESVTEAAVVHGRGISGAIFAGFFAVVEAPFPVAHVRTLDAGLAHLGHSSPATLAAELERLRDVAARSPLFLRQVQTAVDAALPHPDEEEIARALAVSRRTLQRRLGALGTTFKREVARARAMRAARLLELTDASISAISSEVGCTSTTYFSLLVKRWTGATPTAIRARRETSKR